MHTALLMPLVEGRARHAKLLEHLHKLTVAAYCERFLNALRAESEIATPGRLLLTA